MTTVLHIAAKAVATQLEDPEFAALVQHYRGGPLPILSAPLLTAEDVAVLLRIPPKTVLQYAREGRLRSRTIGRRVLFVRAEVETAVLGDALAA